MDTNNFEFINDCANWHGFYEVHHYAMEELLYNFFLCVKLGFVYYTVCQSLPYIFIKKGLGFLFFLKSWFIYV